MSPNTDLLRPPNRSAARSGYHQRARQVFSDHLVRHGLRLTSQRTRILDFLLATDRHMGLDDVYHVLRKHGVGRATVFRTLKTLEECGLVSRVTVANGGSRYEMHLDRPHHDHLICVNCGRIQEVRWPVLEKIQMRACRRLEFEPLWHRHEIFGQCPKCRKKKKS